MAAKKFLRSVAGVLTEVLGVQTSDGVANAGDIPALDDTGKLDVSLMPSGIGADTASIQASEALSAGDWVNIHNVTGSFRVRKADASTPGKEAMGFVLAGVSSGANATVYFEGSNTQVTGQTPGVVFLSATTPGGSTSSVPTTSGQIVQRVGFAPSATVINAQILQPIVLA